MYTLFCNEHYSTVDLIFNKISFVLSKKSFKKGLPTDTLYFQPITGLNTFNSLIYFFRKLTNEKREVTKTGPGLWVSLKVLQGDMTSMQEGSKSHLVVGRPTIARKIGFPELILPNDVRNDLYVNIYSGELSRLSKTADRNVEVVVEAVDDNGAVLSDAVSAGQT